MKASAKMLKSIAKVEKRFGKMEKRFGVEFDECNRRGAGFYDLCELHCKLLQKTVIVAHDGTINW